MADPFTFVVCGAVVAGTWGCPEPNEQSPGGELVAGRYCADEENTYTVSSPAAMTSEPLPRICFTDAVVAYFGFEKYPCRIFWGTWGALSVGAAIGCVIITQGFIVSGFVMLIPHTINSPPL